MPGTGRKIVRGIERGLTKGFRFGRSFWREAAEALDEIPKAVERVGQGIEEVIEHADGAHNRTLEDPCPSTPNGKHSVYVGGPGGKRDRSQKGQVCESCGLFEPEKVDAK